MTNSQECPYCSNIPHVGNNPSLISKSLFDIVLDDDKDVVLTPALGMFVPGYLLLITKNHIPSFAYLSLSQLTNISRYLDELTNILATIFGDYIVFEHGASENMSQMWGGCVVHAHLHLLPIGQSAKQSIISKLVWESLNSFEEITKAKGNTYALMSNNGSYLLNETPKLPSQWIRRESVSLLNINKEWDWQVDFGSDNLDITFKKLQQASLNIRGRKIILP